MLRVGWSSVPTIADEVKEELGSGNHGGLFPTRRLRAHWRSLPSGERAQYCSDPPFPVGPWIAPPRTSAALAAPRDIPIHSAPFGAVNP